MNDHLQAIAADTELHQQMRHWRRDLHAHPETAFEEVRTAARVAELLTSFGLEVHTGLATTGVVATLKGRLPGDAMIALRADMDALNLHELNTFAHCSRHPGKMHGCGHDGHTAMLLGAAAYLAQQPDFAGTVVFIFQPAEEGHAGARVMCEEGLFERFPATAVYGMHNWPGLAAGEFAVHNGPVMASMDKLYIDITGDGGHAAMPHLGCDPVLVAGHLITALQSVVSRNLDPQQSAVVSVTTMHGGDAHNVIPETVTLSGTCRSFDPAVQAMLEQRIGEQVQHICAAFGARGELRYERHYPATINNPEHAGICADIARQLVGAEQVQRAMPPSMGAEDFAFMLQQRPGAYIWLGNGQTGEGHGLHNPHYDFNDEILPLGASYWVALVQAQLKD